ncbi:MAG: nucleotide exchange factor GrpE [Bacteroidales bacterium]|nr:MAG: nucleotide exchange factor GrpE [Bacteroidales bacterium]
MEQDNGKVVEKDEVMQEEAEQNISDVGEQELDMSEKEPTVEEKYDTLNDNYIRLVAEFDNYRKRTIKEKAELIRSGGESVIVDVLPVVDNFERALKTIDSATDIVAIKKGTELIYQQLVKMLNDKGVKEIVTDNVDLDTELHEAITTLPVVEEERKGKIIDCTQKGYTLNDKVIRYAKVVVGE